MAGITRLSASGWHLTAADLLSLSVALSLALRASLSVEQSGESSRLSFRLARSVKQVTIKMDLTGATTTLQVRPSDTIERVLTCILEKEGKRERERCV